MVKAVMAGSNLCLIKSLVKEMEHLELEQHREHSGIGEYMKCTCCPPFESAKSRTHFSVFLEDSSNFGEL